MFKTYVPKTFQLRSLELIATANQIIDEYQADGMTLTLRQLYYQFVARDKIANKQSEYKRMGAIISDARLAGMVDWHAIEDRTRGMRGNSHWTTPAQIVQAAADSFRMDHWDGQDYQPEVWIEKEALSGVIAGICSQLDVPYFACKGYVSQSEMWAASQRLQGYRKRGREPVIIHLGDHDPSGMDMTRDILDRQDLFIGDVKVFRIALNHDQIEQYGPPPNPVKLTDSRSGGYQMRYGLESWELDALEPRVMRDLISETVKDYRDDVKYQAVLAAERTYRDQLEKFVEDWRDNN